VQDPSLAHSLVAKGLHRWSDIFRNGVLLPLPHITHTLGIALTAQEYHLIASSATLATPSRAGPVEVAEARLREVNRFSISAEELVDLHFHHPTRTLTVRRRVGCRRGVLRQGLPQG
jgi:hypothetical protein